MDLRWTMYANKLDVLRQKAHDSIMASHPIKMASTWNPGVQTLQ
jgi:hypothetical protein